MVKIDPWTYWFAALLILVLPLDWLVGTVLAAAFHEACHIFVIRCLGGVIKGFEISPGGAVIKIGSIDNAGELLAAAAGPLGSISTLLLMHAFPQIAISGMIQGIFNLIPIYPLDGGRIVACLAEKLFPTRKELVLRWMEILSYTLIFIAVFVGILFIFRIYFQAVL